MMLKFQASSYLFNEVGTFQVHATFQGITGPKKEVVVNPVPIQFKKRKF